MKELREQLAAAQAGAIVMVPAIFPVPCATDTPSQIDLNVAVAPTELAPLSLEEVKCMNMMIVCAYMNDFSILNPCIFLLERI